MDQERVDAGPPCRPEGVAQQLMRLFEIDIAHHVEVAVEITVADGGDDDIADFAMIDAGNLLGGLWTHAGSPWVAMEGMSGSIRRRRFSGTPRCNRRSAQAFVPPYNVRCGLRHSGRRG